MSAHSRGSSIRDNCLSDANSDDETGGKPLYKPAIGDQQQDCASGWVESSRWGPEKESQLVDAHTNVHTAFNRTSRPD